jgi:hypothetical protein
MNFITGIQERKWGYNYTNLKGLEKVNGEMSLIMTIYNMKRTLNILGFDTLMEKLKNWQPNYPNDENKSKKGTKIVFLNLKNYSKTLQVA